MLHYERAREPSQKRTPAVCTARKGEQINETNVFDPAIQFAYFIPSDVGGEQVEP